jgi:hypothetical protein
MGGNITYSYEYKVDPDRYVKALMLLLLSHSPSEQDESATTSSALCYTPMRESTKEATQWNSRQE